MSIDMHEYKFILELEKLPSFSPSDSIDPDIRRIDFPAWRAIFSSLALYGHSTGYRLFSFDAFFNACARGFKHPAHKGRFTRWFEPNDVERTKQRLKFWYESGLAETYLYACLVDVFEDILRTGVVFYDARLDWKQKWDVGVITGANKFCISAIWGNEDERSRVEQYRDSIERARKQRTSISSHWDNSERHDWTHLTISRSNADCQNVNGVRLFSISSTNTLLDGIFTKASAQEVFLFPESREERKQLYYQMIGR